MHETMIWPTISIRFVGTLKKSLDTAENVPKNIHGFSCDFRSKKKGMSDFLASSSSWKNSKRREAGLKHKSARFLVYKLMLTWLLIFRDTLLVMHVFVNENCYLSTHFTELHLFYWLLVVSSAILTVLTILTSAVFDRNKGSNKHRMQESQTLLKITHNRNINKGG